MFSRRRLRSLSVAFCDSCATVCTATCRASALRERALQAGLRLSPRV